MDFEKYPKVAVDFMNDDHQEFVALINKAELLLNDKNNNKEDILALMTEVFQHCQEHFAREEQAMQRVNFPPFPVHKMEHERVLSGMQQQLEQFKNSNTNDVLLRYISQDIPAWFEQHLATMDTVTANYIQQFN